jgi:hypothetical protein
LRRTGDTTGDSAPEILSAIGCREALTGSAHQVKGRERRGPRHQETTMPKYLLHDEYTPQELAGGRS